LEPGSILSILAEVSSRREEAGGPPSVSTELAAVAALLSAEGEHYASAGVEEAGQFF